MCFRPASIDAPIICPDCGKAYPADQALTMTECANCGYKMSEAMNNPGAPAAVPAAPGVPGAPKPSGTPKPSITPSAPAAPPAP